MLSLFIALEKRKAELYSSINKKTTRKVLKIYSKPLVEKYESVLSTSTVITYSLWAYGPIVGGASSPWMIFTIPLVILGIFRYQMLSEILKTDNISELEVGDLESPEKIILKDKPMKLIVLSWVLITIFIGFFS